MKVHILLFLVTVLTIGRADVVKKIGRRDANLVSEGNKGGPQSPVGLETETEFSAEDEVGGADQDYSLQSSDGLGPSGADAFFQAEATAEANNGAEYDGGGQIHGINDHADYSLLPSEGIGYGDQFGSVSHADTLAEVQMGKITQTEGFQADATAQAQYGHQAKHTPTIQVTPVIQPIAGKEYGVDSQYEGIGLANPMIEENGDYQFDEGPQQPLIQPQEYGEQANEGKYSEDSQFNGFAQADAIVKDNDKVQHDKGPQTFAPLQENPIASYLDETHISNQSSPFEKGANLSPSIVNWTGRPEGALNNIYYMPNSHEEQERFDRPVYGAVNQMGLPIQYNGPTQGNSLGYYGGPTQGNSLGYYGEPKQGNSLGYGGPTYGNSLGYYGGPTQENLLGHYGGPNQGNSLGYYSGPTQGNSLGHYGGPTLGNSLGHYGGPTKGNSLGYYSGPTQGNLLGQYGGPTQGNSVGHYGGPTKVNSLGYNGGPTQGNSLGQYVGPTQGNSLGHYGGPTKVNSLGYYGGPTQGNSLGQYGGPTQGNSWGGHKTKAQLQHEELVKGSSQLHYDALPKDYSQLQYGPPAKDNSKLLYGSPPKDNLQILYGPLAQGTSQLQYGGPTHGHSLSQHSGLAKENLGRPIGSFPAQYGGGVKHAYPNWDLYEKSAEANATVKGQVYKEANKIVQSSVEQNGIAHIDTDIKTNEKSQHIGGAQSSTEAQANVMIQAHSGNQNEAKVQTDTVIQSRGTIKAAQFGIAQANHTGLQTNTGSQYTGEARYKSRYTGVNPHLSHPGGFDSKALAQTSKEIQNRGRGIYGGGPKYGEGAQANLNSHQFSGPAFKASGDNSENQLGFYKQPLPDSGIRQNPQRHRG